MPGNQRYCSQCGSDLYQPGTQVWNRCNRCGGPVHITEKNCRACGQPANAPVQVIQPVRIAPEKKKRKPALALLLLLIPVLVIAMLVGAELLENAQPTQPQLQGPGTTTTQKPVERPTNPIWTMPTQATTMPDTQPATKPTETKPTAPAPTEPKPTEPKPTAPKPTAPKPTEPKPTEPVPTEPTKPDTDILSEFADNHYLSAMGDGYCETMTGELVVFFLFVSDPTDGWTAAELAEAEAALLDELRHLLGEAQTYGVTLNIRYVTDSVTISQEYDRNSDNWREEAMKQAGIGAGYNDQRELEKYYEADDVPVVFVVDEPGRSFATSYYSGKGFESLVILEKDYSALRHEMCHLFGAKDMYFPTETVEAAKAYLPNGIMYGDCRGDVDALTAFVIGWTQELSDEAIAFLRATNDLTEEYIQQAKDQDQLTGFGTRYYDDGSYYTGYLVGGVRHGEGSYYWVDGSIFTGTWVNGVRCGYGEMTRSDGSGYKGYWEDDQYSGTGTAWYVGGDTYTGDFLQGDRHGQGTYTWTDGTVYTGAWANGERVGQGTMWYSDGYVYTGEWLDGERHGYGEMQGNDGYSYKGQWKTGQYHGTGTQTWGDGSYYTGDFASGYRHGKGMYTWSDGSSYVGDWVQGERTGKGTLTWPSGDYYTGDFVDDEMTGYGVRTYSGQTSRYEGQFLNGQRHGWGTYYYPDGSTYTGKWEYDSRVG